MGYAYVQTVGYSRPSRRGYEEEGGYEYAAEHHDGEDGEEEAHTESAVFYQPLGEAAGFTFPIWNEGHEAGSRCVQYGGHWKGHTCVGVRIRGGNSHACKGDAIAEAVIGPFGLLIPPLGAADVAAALITVSECSG
jgi:hypothetical protein